MPWVVWGFFKLITPFIDPLTREKLKFNEDMRQYVPTEQLWTEFHGDLEFEYEHSVYWPALQKLCLERREEKKKRWEAGGKLIGEHEDYLAGHDEFGVAGAPAKVEETLEQLKIADDAPVAAKSEPEEAKSEEPKAEETKAAEPSAEVPHESKATEGDETQKSA